MTSRHDIWEPMYAAATLYQVRVEDGSGNRISGDYYTDLGAAVRAAREAVGRAEDARATISDDKHRVRWASDHYEVVSPQDWSRSYDTDHREEAVDAAMKEIRNNPERKSIHVVDTLMDRFVWEAKWTAGGELWLYEGREEEWE